MHSEKRGFSTSRGGSNPGSAPKSRFFCSEFVSQKANRAVLIHWKSGSFGLIMEALQLQHFTNLTLSVELNLVPGYFSLISAGC